MTKVPVADEYYDDWASDNSDLEPSDDIIAAAKSVVDDINDRIDHEFLFPSVETTVNSRDEFGGQFRFRTIDEE